MRVLRRLVLLKIKPLINSDMSYLKVAMPMPQGGTHIIEMDEATAKECLAEMETWGEDCSQDSKELRQALRDDLQKQNDERTLTR